MNEYTVTKQIGGKEITLKSGLFAKQANGAVRCSIGNTEVIGVATMGKENTEQDFFPLSVHYTEKFYASGKIPGGYFKREGKPTASEVLVSRMIDRPLRPMFQQGFRTEIQIIPTVLSMDLKNPADIAGMNSASAALTVSDIPFSSPVASVRVCKKDNSIIINPTYEEMKDKKLEIIVSGTDNAITMIEGHAHEVSEEEMLNAIDQGHAAIKEIVALQKELRAKCGKDKKEVAVFSFDKTLKEKIINAYKDKITAALQITDKQSREEKIAALYTEAETNFGADLEENLQKQIKDIIHEEIEKKVVRDFILNKDQRTDGRSMDEIRPLSSQVDVLKMVHGSALFTRGQTQALAVSTLGSGSDQLMVDEAAGEREKPFFLHYNFPPYSVGECGRIGATGRREIGHGMLAEKSLQPMIPDDFPYTIRTVSEIMESNGSSSMATICASTMSLMAAGVPLKNPVAGIAMGLIIENKKYKILTDIQGMEDHLGDMDFKVAGTAKGITGFQLDIKVEGINREIMAQALEQAKTARMQILENMGKAISEPRKEMNPNIPRLETISIPEEKVKILIGPSGKTIKSIVAETGSKIDIADNGEVNIFAQDQAALQNTIKIIESHVGVPRLNKVYDGVVKKIMPFGAFIEIMPHTDGLCHISQIANERVNNVSDYLKEGDKVKAKVIKIDNNGKISLTCKNLPPVSQ